MCSQVRLQAHTDEGEITNVRPQKVVDKLGKERENKRLVCGSCYKTRDGEQSE